MTIWVDLVVWYVTMVAVRRYAAVRLRDGRLSLNSAAILAGLVWAGLPLLLGVTGVLHDALFVVIWALLNFLGAAGGVRFVYPTVLPGVREFWRRMSRTSE